MYEAHNKRSKVKLDFGFDVKCCYSADLNENRLKEIAVKNNSVQLEIKPFEIVTVLAEYK